MGSALHWAGPALCQFPLQGGDLVPGARALGIKLDRYPQQRTIPYRGRQEFTLDLNPRSGSSFWDQNRDPRLDPIHGCMPFQDKPSLTRYSNSRWDAELKTGNRETSNGREYVPAGPFPAYGVRAFRGPLSGIIGLVLRFHAGDNKRIVMPIAFAVGEVAVLHGQEAQFARDGGCGDL